MIRPADLAYMDMAYGLAAKALGRTHPNPYVGAVVVRGGQVIGHGFHEAAGRPHAEATALARAGSKARGSTLYVTLEPCVHWGRTPPCVEAVIAARPARVVVSALDPNPLVHGHGVRRLRAAGIAVEVGALAGRNARLNAMYAKHITTGRPYVTLKAAVSLDGKMATRTGDSRWISSPEAREYARLLRGEHDAVLVGSGTAGRDDPLLTVRHRLWKGKRIVRALLDSALTLSPRARVLRTTGEGPVVVYARRGASRVRAAALERRGAEVVLLPARSEGRLDLGRVLDDLGGREVAGVLVEGGGQVAASFLDARLVDRLVLVLSPRLIGGGRAVSLYAGRGAAVLAGAPRLKDVSTRRLGGDLIVEGIF